MTPSHMTKMDSKEQGNAFQRSRLKNTNTSTQHSKESNTSDKTLSLSHHSENVHTSKASRWECYQVKHLFLFLFNKIMLPKVITIHYKKWKVKTTANPVVKTKCDYISF